MDTNKMREPVREQFEAWHSSVVWGKPPHEKYSNGDYINQHVQRYWRGWQASREALVVELPRDVDQFADDDPGRRAFSLHTNTAYRECRRAIEAQGLKVTP